MASLTDALVSLLDTNWDTSERNPKPAIVNSLDYGEGVAFPVGGGGCVVIWPSYQGFEIHTAKNWREWEVVNECWCITHADEDDLEEMVEAVKEVLDNHQCTGYWKHYVDKTKNVSTPNTTPVMFKMIFNINSRMEETY